MTTSPTVHDRYSCSGSERWLACPASLLESEGTESTSSRYANEGTVAHDVAAAALARLSPPHVGKAETAGVDLPEYVEVCNACNSRYSGGCCTACGGVEYRLDREMPGHLRRYTDFVCSLRTGTVLAERIEQRVVSQRWPEHGGTIDYLIVTIEDGQTCLHVVDLKYGRGVEVEAQGNTQLLCYLALAREQFADATVFRATIVQPRVGRGVSTWEVTPEVLDHFDLRVADSMLNPERKQSGSHCRWCPVRLTCDALQGDVDQALQDFTTLDDCDQSERARRVARWLELTPAMRSVINAAPVEARRLMALGQEVRGWKAVAKIGNRSWSGEPEAVAAALEGRGVPVDDIWTVSIRTPAQIEKSGHKAAVEGLTHRSQTGVSVVVSTDKRPAVDLCGQDFSVLSDSEEDSYE